MSKNAQPENKNITKQHKTADKYFKIDPYAFIGFYLRTPLLYYITANIVFQYIKQKEQAKTRSFCCVIVGAHIYARVPVIYLAKLTVSLLPEVIFVPPADTVEETDIIISNPFSVSKPYISKEISAEDIPVDSAVFI